jgi:hypothetical protein
MHQENRIIVDRPVHLLFVCLSTSNHLRISTRWDQQSSLTINDDQMGPCFGLILLMMCSLYSLFKSILNGIDWEKVVSAASDVVAAQTL